MTARVAFVLACLLLGACAAVNDTIGVSGADACIRKNCRDPDARDYTQCESACRAQYIK